MKEFFTAERLIRKRMIAAMLALLSLIIAGGGWLLNYFNQVHFMGHGMCFMWDSGMIELMVTSNLTIAFSYFVISTVLVYEVLKRHNKNHFVNPPSLAFGAFIFLCGITHIMSVITIWYPIYWTEGLLSLATALVSLFVAVTVFHKASFLRDLPDVLHIQELNGKLEHRISVLKATSPYAGEDAGLNDTEDLTNALNTLKEVAKFLNGFESSTKNGK